MSLILASGSKARAQMLKAAGLDFEVKPADIDERAIEDVFDGTQSALAKKLAGEKAKNVSALYPEALVIGSDQLLVCDGQILSKARDKIEARDKLSFLRGQTHELISGVAVAVSGQCVWADYSAAKLHMRDFDDAFLERYIGRAGDALTQCVGGYELEGLGVQLFDNIEGDYFTILGMPLLKLLAYLRGAEGGGI